MRHDPRAQPRPGANNAAPRRAGLRGRPEQGAYFNTSLPSGGGHGVAVASVAVVAPAAGAAVVPVEDPPAGAPVSAPSA
jgi:hypothetical protein